MSLLQPASEPWHGDSPAWFLPRVALKKGFPASNSAFSARTQRLMTGQRHLWAGFLFRTFTPLSACLIGEMVFPFIFQQNCLISVNSISIYLSQIVSGDLCRRLPFDPHDRHLLQRLSPSDPPLPAQTCFRPRLSKQPIREGIG